MTSKNRRARRARQQQCERDAAHAAARKLLGEGKWEHGWDSSIDALNRATRDYVASSAKRLVDSVFAARLRKKETG